MAHELDVAENGKARMVSGRGMTPWHGLGTVVQGLMTSKECLELSGLDHRVEKEPVYTATAGKDGQPEFHKVQGRFATVRQEDRKVLGIVGGDYTVCQNEDAFAFLDALVDEDGAKYDTAGALFGGRRIWISILLPDSHKIAGDQFDSYVLFSNTHDGSRGITAAYTKIRTVCKNTETLALRGAKHTWSIHHRTTLEGKLAEARESLKLVTKYDEKFETAVEKMIAQQVTDDTFMQIMKDVFPDQARQQEKNIEAVLTNRKESETIDDAWRDTAWGAYNAFTEWVDHKREYRTDEARMKGVLLGQGAKFRNKIGNRLLEASK